MRVTSDYGGGHCWRSKGSGACLFDGSDGRFTRSKVLSGIIDVLVRGRVCVCVFVFSAFVERAVSQYEH